MPENIVAALRRHADELPRNDGGLTVVLLQAADEIEYLRQRCIEIDNEWRRSIENESRRTAD